MSTVPQICSSAQPTIINQVRTFTDEQTGREVRQLTDFEHGAHLGYFRMFRQLPDGRMLAWGEHARGMLACPLVIWTRQEGAVTAPENRNALELSWVPEKGQFTSLGFGLWCSCPELSALRYPRTRGRRREA